MKHNHPVISILLTMLIFLWASTYANDESSRLLYNVEENPQLMIDAKSQAIKEGLPLSIHIPGSYFIYVIAIEKNQVVYGIIENLAHPGVNFRTATFNQLKLDYDLSGAEFRYHNPNSKSSPSFNDRLQPGDSLLLIPDWSNDKVLAFDAQSGDLVDSDFIPTSDTLSSPKEARVAPWGTITVSDQLEDVVQEFDTSGVFLNTFAPAGGPSTAIMDNIRGHNYLSTGNLIVAVGGGANDDAIAEFNQAGNYIGNFIANGGGGLDSPFGIWLRSTDVLVSASTSDAIHRYDLSGNFLDIFTPVSNFPQQVIELANGNVAVANFGGTSGILIYDASGNPLATLTGITGNRGLWQLGNGNFITTNGAGVHEVDGISGALVRTIFPGASAQFVNLYVMPPQMSQKILISEFVVTPTVGEFAEIYNPSDSPVLLSDYYLTDATFAAGGQFYYNIVTDTNYGGGGFGDFHARFPDGAMIQPAEYQTIALNGDADFFGEYGVNPTYEMDQAEHASGVPDAIPDMQEAVLYSIFGSDSTNNPGLSNGDEIIILYHWNGMSDLVADVDYVLYNSASPTPNDEAVDKTGVRIDGPDADTLSSEYLPDTPTANQLSAINHSFGVSVHRSDFAEGSQIGSGGNGVSGANETSENLDQTFSNNSVPSPNAAWQPINTARVQMVHNAADPALAVVDVYQNGLVLLNDFSFREATPFIDTPAGVLINYGFAPGNSSSVADTLRNFPVIFDQDSSYIGFATGVLDPLNFLPNPDGEDIFFTIHGKDQARELSQTPGMVEVFTMHGITDVPAVDLTARGVGVLYNDVIYGEVTEYVIFTPAIYILDITDSTGTDFYASFELDLSGLADSALALFASGFAEPDSNQNGPQAGMFAALPNGTVIELPQVMNYASLQLIHNSPDPALDTVDIYLNDSLFVDDLVFRQATRYLDVPANFKFLLGIAPGNSSSAGDTILALEGELPPNISINGLLSGVLDTSNFAPNPDGLDITFNIRGNDSARTVSSTPGQTEFYVMHGATDAPAVDVVARGLGTLFEDVFYSDATEYINLPPTFYTIDLYDSTGNTLLASFTADLNTLADSALTVFASGFLDTVANQNGPAFGLFAALANGTVIELPEIPLGIVNLESLLPVEYALHQNYPNPFNPTTTIRYDLKQSGDVQLVIYYLLGQKIRTLVNTSQDAGYQNVVWDGRNDSGTSVASGIYIYRLEAGDYVNTRKMILMK